ncbi:DoxX family protein [Crocinitomix catalasitica]|uniref:DoxX family protein n=1 Tax=Crocinitomix catalasitica TaxID=184607 RepID=UPI00047F764A|nr:DoxX family protein [Crocinitomix catalasitica]
MKSRTKKNVYYVSTSLLTLMMLATIGNSLFNTEFAKRFSEIGFPVYLIIPLMTAKTLGLIAIWTNKTEVLKEWAYSGFFFLFLLAFLAEINAPVPDYISPLLALVLITTSYIFWKKK